MHMSKPLTLIEAKAYLDRLKTSVAKKECWSCDCMQGLLTQLELDCPQATELVDPLKVPARQMHSCLGCEPCPPGAVFAEYLRGMNQKAAESQCCENGCSCKDQEGVDLR
jgi:hypothetical protein